MSENEDPLNDAGAASTADSEQFYVDGEYCHEYPYMPPALVLTPHERACAVEAICRAASGDPVTVALNILMGISVLDGPPNGPILAWPPRFTAKERHGWHLRQAEHYEDFFKRQEEHAQRWSQSAPLKTHSQGSSLSSVELEQPRPHSRGVRSIPEPPCVALDELSAVEPKKEPRNPFEGYEVQLNLHTLPDGSQCIKGMGFIFRPVAASDECTGQ